MQERDEQEDDFEAFEKTLEGLIALDGKLYLNSAFLKCMYLVKGRDLIKLFTKILLEKGTQIPTYTEVTRPD